LPTIEDPMENRYMRPVSASARESLRHHYGED
jgi:hypothetical protein